MNTFVQLSMRCRNCLTVLVGAIGLATIYVSFFHLPFHGGGQWLSAYLINLPVIIGFGVFVFLAALLWAPLLLVALLAISGSIFLEFMQIYIPGEHINLDRLISSFIGIGAGIIFYILILAINRKNFEHTINDC
jgi:hypothetical protein